MKDNEIKEMLEEMKSIIDIGKNINGIKVDGYGFHGRGLKLLYDYITNLQQAIKDTKDTAEDMLYELKQENERLNNMLNNADNKNLSLIEKINEKQDIIDKAIEYIEDILYPIGTCVNGSDLPYESIESLLNILQNGIKVED